MNNKNNKTKYLIFACLLFLFVGSFFIGDYVYAAEAGVKNTLATFVANAVGSIFQFLIWILGGILYVLIYILIWVAQYNDFINSNAVKNGWTITRDLANMFFIVILLIIAFATILRKEEYSYKKLLPKLLIMAVLINFSKTICGIFIDIAQVIMLTFVNGFKEMGGANLTDMLGISETMKISSDTSIKVGALSIVGTYVLAFLYVLISVVVVLTMVAILVMRMVMLWIYIVLSPLAYLLAAFPAGQKYSQQWWSEFSKNVIIGPVLAFFIWLSFVAIPVETTGSKVMNTSGVTGDAPQAGLAQAGSPDSMLKFIISIGMLVGGLMVSQQIGGAAGGIAGKGMGALQKGQGLGAAIGKAGIIKAGRALDAVQVGAQQKIANKLGVQDYIPKSMNYRMIGQAWKENRASSLEKYESKMGGVGAWRDTFGKYVRLGQYGAIRKGRGKQSEDISQAMLLEDENGRMQKRLSLMAIPLEHKGEKASELNKDRGRIINMYNKKGLDGIREFNEDISALSYDKDSNIAQQYRDKERENNNKIEKMRNEKIIGFKGATQYEPKYYKSNAKSYQEKKEKDMLSRTGGEDFSVISELMQALKEGESDNVMSALKILTKNNDLNEALKDNRIIHLMAKQGGYLEKHANQMQLSVDQTQQVIDDFKKNPVTPAYAQVMIQQMMKETKMEDSLAARQANEISSASFGAGNSIAYAISAGNETTGNYEFSKLKYENGALKASEDRINAIIGKFSNLESQKKMINIHPDVFIKEAQDGSSAGLSEEGKEFILSLTSHDLAQISRLRLDNIRKIGGSKQTLRDLKNLALNLDKAGDKQKAEIVKFFTGYIKGRFEGKGLDEKNKTMADKSFDEIV